VPCEVSGTPGGQLVQVVAEPLHVRHVESHARHCPLLRYLPEGQLAHPDGPALLHVTHDESHPAQTVLAVAVQAL